MQTIRQSVMRANFVRLYRPVTLRRFSDASFEEPVRKDIIRNALLHVHEYGWTDECIVKAVKELGLPPLSHRIVGRGASEMVQYVLEEKLSYVNNNMSLKVESDRVVSEFSQERLQSAIDLHLDYILPYRAHWAEAIALSLTPAEMPFTAKAVFQLSDDLCMHSGIRSSRLDWYYERAILTALYSATELYLLTDTSDNLSDTRYAFATLLISCID